MVWVEDAIPAGATAQVNNDVWNWIATNPTPFSGSSAHQSQIAAGLHEHYFTGATTGMAVVSGDILTSYVYIDPANAPSEIMLQWTDGTSWEHRAFWGSDSITYGVERHGQPAQNRRPSGQGPMGSAPGSRQSGGAGRPYPDRNVLFPVQRPSDVGPRRQTDRNPPGTFRLGGREAARRRDRPRRTAATAWNWITANPTPVPASQAHQSNLAAGLHEHSFSNAAATQAVHAGDVLFAYVYLDPANPPSEVMLEWNAGNWEHRAYWGANSITYGTNGTASRQYMGALPGRGTMGPPPGAGQAGRGGRPNPQRDGIQSLRWARHLGHGRRFHRA